MSIPSNQYLQFRDYLTQLLNLSGRGQLPLIQQQTIAERLHVDPSGVCKFLGNQTAAPRKMMSNFALTYPLEVQKWPKNLNKINRVLQENDAWYFLTLRNPTPQPVQIIPTPASGRSLQQTPRMNEVNPISNSVQRPVAISRLQPIKIAPVAVLKSNILQASNAPIPNPQPRRVIQAPLLKPEPRRSPISHIPRTPKSIAPIVRISKLLQAPIAISYRGHHSDKDAGGMLFDHIRFQSITNFPTHALLPKEAGSKQAIISLFRSALKAHPAKLPHGINDKNMIIHPPFTQSSADLGLLIIPGRVHKIENEPIRLKHEYQVIRDALNRGQPLLGICAGSWRIWEQLDIWTKSPDSLSADALDLVNWHEENHTLVDATDHTYGGGMIRLDQMGVKATYNVQLHDVVFQKDSWVKAALKTKKTRISVNSVHWKAVNSEFLPLNVKISGLSAQNPSIQKMSRQNNPMKPQENEVEAFESLAGAPIAGIQWHPEGYNYDDADGSLHGNLLKYMALAGSAYAAKRKMLRELPKKDLYQS